MLHQVDLISAAYTSASRDARGRGRALLRVFEDAAAERAGHEQGEPSGHVATGHVRRRPVSAVQTLPAAIFDDCCRQVYVSQHSIFPIMWHGVARVVSSAFLSRLYRMGLHENG